MEGSSVARYLAASQLDAVVPEDTWMDESGKQASVEADG